jgi:hypothetical protein
LNPFKIQSYFKSQKLIEFIFQILFRFGCLPNGESCSSYANLSVLNSHIFWRLGRCCFLFLFSGVQTSLDKFTKIQKWEGPTCQSLIASTCVRWRRATRVTALYRHPVAPYSDGRHPVVLEAPTHSRASLIRGEKMFPIPLVAPHQNRAPLLCLPLYSRR